MQRQTSRSPPRPRLCLFYEGDHCALSLQYLVRTIPRDCEKHLPAPSEPPQSRQNNQRRGEPTGIKQPIAMQTNYTGVMEILTCPHEGCHCLFGIDSLVVSRLRDSKETFYCTFGHSQSFRGTPEIDKLKKELEAKTSLITALTGEIQTLKEKPKRTRQKKVV